MNINTVLFDMDGTLIDTNALIHDSFVHTLKHYGLSFTDEEILTFNGPPLIDTFTNINPLLADQMVETYREHNIAQHDQYVTVFPTVKETLEELRQQGIKMAVVSAKMSLGVEQSLAFTDLRQYFDVVVSVDDVIKPKPHPEPVLKAIEQLGSSPETSLMVGDNSHDIESGNNAGVKTVGVSWSSKGATFLQQFEPTYMIDEMREILKIVGV